MKKTISIAAMICLAFSLFSFSAPSPASENETVKASFKSKFSDASSVKWRKQAGFFFVDFVNNKEQMAAAYDQGGNLLGTSRFINIKEVPADLVKEAESTEKNSKAVSEVLEITFDGQKSYLLTVVSEKFLVTCVADADGVVTEKDRKRLHK